MRSRVLLLVAYDGTQYSGFALQTNAPTVCGELTRAVAHIDPEASALTAASRTDRGVHAQAQPVSFTSSKQIEPRGWVLAINQQLPRDICVTYAAPIEIDFDPRKDPISKRYRYRIFRSQVDDPFICRTSWRVGQPLDLEVLTREADRLVGRYDFRAFRSVDDNRTETVRTLSRVEVERHAGDERLVDLVVEGDRFMYNMVRIIAGTLVDVGRARLSPGAVERAIASGQRSDLGMTAPAHGLTLERVFLRTRAGPGWPMDGVASDVWLKSSSKPD